MARQGWRKYLRSPCGKDVAADDIEHDDDGGLPYLYIWSDGIPTSGRMGSDLVARCPVGAGGRGIRHIHVCLDTVDENVDEFVFVVGGVEFLDGGNSISRDGDGPRARGSCMAIPLASLFRDLSDVHLRGLSALRVLDTRRLPFGLRPLAPAALRTTQKGDDAVCLYGLGIRN